MERLNIPMEAETIPMLIGGFSIVLLLTLICIIVLWSRNKSISYAWFIAQIIFLILGFKSALKIFDLTVPSSMLSEEISLVIGVSALYWAASMVCMLIGIWQLSSRLRRERNGYLE